MALIKPALPPAAEGKPITVGAWNALAAGIEGLYVALGDVDREHVQVAVSARGEIIADARVVGTPVKPAGAPLAAIAPIGPFGTHTLVGVRPGDWKIVVEAPGFATAVRDLHVDASAAAAPAPLAVELARTTVPAPDLVGMPLHAANYLTQWAGLRSVGEDFDKPAFLSDDGPIIMQDPSAVQIARGATLNFLFNRAASASIAPSVTVVPDFIGYPASSVASAWGRQITIEPPDPRVEDTRLVGQDLRPGAVVPTPAKLNVTYEKFDHDNATFGAFPTTHTALADTPIAGVLAKVAVHPGLGPASNWWTPWDVARIYRDDDHIADVLKLFAEFGATVERPEDYEAIWKSYLVALHWGTP